MMNRSHLHAVRTPTNPLAEQIRSALETLAVCAEAAALLKENAERLDRIAPYLRGRMERASVAFTAFVEDIEGRLPHD